MKTFLSVFFALFAFLLADAPKTRADCDAVFKYRQSQLQAPPASTPLSEFKKNIISKALELKNRADAYRVQDAHWISQELERAGIRTMSFRELKQAGQDFVKHVRQAVKILPDGGMKTDYTSRFGNLIPADESQYHNWFEDGVVGNFEKFLTPLKESDLQTEMGKRNLSPTNVFIHLTKRMLEGPTENAFADKKPLISAYHARLILLFRLIWKNPGLPWQQDLKLVQNLRDFLPEKADIPVLCRKSEAFCSIPTDGYIYGALNSNSERLFSDGGLSLPTTDPAPSPSVDCSTFIQEVLVKLGYPYSLFPNPIGTSKMAEGKMPGIEQGYFEVTRLRAEQELEPGDFIFWRGHITVFEGYRKSTLDLAEPIVFEATGGAARAVREAPFRDGEHGLYKEKTDCAMLNREYYRFRVLKLPE